MSEKQFNSFEYLLFSEKHESLPVWEKGKIDLRCVATKQETHDVKTFYFMPEQPTIFLYKPGQFLTLQLEIEGKRVARTYTISSTPSKPYHISITVKMVDDGNISHWIHTNIKVGSKITAIGPAGKFTCVDVDTQKFLFISGGSGITPVMSMTRWLLDTNSDAAISFIHSAKSIDDLIFYDELQYVQAYHHNFDLHFTITRDADDGWEGFRGRLTIDMLKKMQPDFKKYTVFACGPNQFMAKTKDWLIDEGLPESQYHQESFGIPKGK